MNSGRIRNVRRRARWAGTLGVGLALACLLHHDPLAGDAHDRGDLLQGRRIVAAQPVAARNHFPLLVGELVQPFADALGEIGVERGVGVAVGRDVSGFGVGPARPAAIHMRKGCVPEQHRGCASAVFKHRHGEHRPERAVQRVLQAAPDRLPILLETVAAVRAAGELGARGAPDLQRDALDLVVDGAGRTCTAVFPPV